VFQSLFLDAPDIFCAFYNKTETAYAVRRQPPLLMVFNLNLKAHTAIYYNLALQMRLFCPFIAFPGCRFLRSLALSPLLFVKAA